MNYVKIIYINIVFYSMFQSGVSFEHGPERVERPGLPNVKPQLVSRGRGNRGRGGL